MDRLHVFADAYFEFEIRVVYATKVEEKRGKGKKLI